MLYEAVNITNLIEGLTNFPDFNHLTIVAKLHKVTVEQLIYSLLLMIYNYTH